ncbi:BgTH12-07720 [Blumeria graminis f. sp. triticale]|nr:BgTH12-07720 [Blumeria graminis f. sp. triticale]
MSIIQIEELVLHQLRSKYLELIPDGVGERLITLDDAALGIAKIRTPGWRQTGALKKRTHSPPIPTAVASEYFQGPPRSAVFQHHSLDENSEERILVPDGIKSDIVGLGTAIKRRRRREQMEEEDSSDLSDESDDDVDRRSSQQIKFSKMPIRNRSGSSPIRGSNLRRLSIMHSPIPTPASQSRRGSQSALEILKARARANTNTSGEVSSDNESDLSTIQIQRDAALNLIREDREALRQSSDSESRLRRRISALDKEADEEDSYESGLDSDFVGSLDSHSIMHGIESPVNASSENLTETNPRSIDKSSSKQHKTDPEVLTALPPARPISTIQPKSLLSAAIKARKNKFTLPFESFASLSGQGESNPLNLRIWTLFVTSSTKSFEVLLKRRVHDSDATDRQVTVADLIGLSLWRYAQDKLEPLLPAEKLNINRWTLRMVEDEEVDYDFPALDRTKPVVAFSMANNRAARSRSGAKLFDEFALVEATEDQFLENQVITSQFRQEPMLQSDDLTPNQPKPLPQPGTSFTSITSIQPRYNPVLTPMVMRSNGIPADAPSVGTAVTPSSTRGGVQKLLRIHIHSADAAPGQLITLEVTSDTYLADILDLVCKRRQLDKAAHVLKLTGSGTVVLLDRTVESIGNRVDLDLFRRRFATDGILTMTGSPSSSSPKISMTVDRPESRKVKKGNLMSTHPLALNSMKQDELGSANYRKYTVWRKQPMRFVGMNERLLAIDGEYLHIMPASTGKTLFEGQGKTTTVHFSNIVGCKVTRRHPTNFKVVIYKTTETKRYDFEAKSAEEAAEIVFEIKKGISPYHDV